MQPRSMCLSLTRTVTLLATPSISPNSFRECAFTHSRSTSQLCAPISDSLSLMPLSLRWLHPLMLLSHSVYLASYSCSSSRTRSLISHARTKHLLSRSSRMPDLPFPLPLARLRLSRTNRTEVEDHNLRISRGVEPADHKDEYTREDHPRADAITSSDCLLLPPMHMLVSAPPQRNRNAIDSIVLSRGVKPAAHKGK